MHKPSMGSAQSKNVNRQRREREREAAKRKKAQQIKSLFKVPKEKIAKWTSKVDIAGPGTKKWRQKTIEVKRVISLRGRVSHAQAPLVGMPTTPQDFLLGSSVINSYKYWTKEHRLRIWFVSGHVYDYYDVPAKVIHQLGLAPSKGRYFYYDIRKSFKYKQIK